ncbi:MAG: N-6 DNA methylase [Bacteroidales bacterium]|nr:N-6 DNA methylase [Bacteroidales bacterium]
MHEIRTGQESRFFEKGKKTKDIWYYEHTLPEGAKAYNKTKPIRIEEFDTIKDWWTKREENEVSWKVSIDTIKDRGFDLDIKNPNKVVEVVVYDRKTILAKLEHSFQASLVLLNELKKA